MATKLTTNESRATLVDCDICDERITEVPYSTPEVIAATVEWAIIDHKKKVHPEAVPESEETNSETEEPS